MEGFKEFQGKDLDSAIEEACGYFDAAREKLEIEIVQDSKSGIFGIVGARKAKVRARRVQLRETVESILGRKGAQADASESVPAAAAPEKNRAPREEGDQAANGQQDKRNSRSRNRKPAQEPAAEQAEGSQGRDARQPRGAGPRSERQGERSPERAAENGNARSSAKAPDRGSDKTCDRSADKPDGEGRGDNRGESRGDRSRDRAKASGRAQNDQNGQNGEEGRRAEGRGRRGDSRSESRDSRDSRDSRNAAKEGGREAARQPKGMDVLDDDFEEAAEGLPAMPMEQLDQERLDALVRETVRQLVRPIVGDDVHLDVKLGGDRVQVGIDSEEDSGLLIGREGQTLAALQYMISRIVSRGMNAAVRVQLDAGEYRRRQDEKLREMALALAEKVRLSGRSYSTRPLSSYHRRIVHVCLQEAVDVQTRSTGDGPMKRVVILRKKTEKN